MTKHKFFVALLTSLVATATAIATLDLDSRVTVIATAVVTIAGAFGVGAVPNKPKD